MRVAVFDAKGRLVGVRNVQKPRLGDVDAGDLPADGQYRWTGKTFEPVGYLAGKPKAPAVNRDRATFLALRALLNGHPIPQEVRDWCDWYERNTRGAT